MVFRDCHDDGIAFLAVYNALVPYGYTLKYRVIGVKLQSHITANYYTCTDEILAGLGKMYVADGRFKKNIDKYGDGTAEFASEAIAVFRREK